MGTGEKRGSSYNPGAVPGTCAKVNSIIIMAEIFNNRICVFANELIIFNPKRKLGVKMGSFLKEHTIRW